ncbi:MAG: DUF459 domain-containing protein [Gallionellaceae bacterium]
MKLSFKRNSILFVVICLSLIACQPAPEKFESKVAPSIAPLDSGDTHATVLIDSSEKPTVTQLEPIAPTVIVPKIEKPSKPKIQTIAPMADGVFTVAFVGDSLADGIWGGFYRKYIRDKRFKMLRTGRNSTGLARPDFYDWQKGAEEILASNQVDAVVITLGFNDNKDLYQSGKHSYRYGAKKWDEQYLARVVELAKRFKDKGIPTYWVGLPIVRGEDYAGKMKHINTLFESGTKADLAEFIPLWNLYMGADSKFTTHVKDKKGRNKRIRAGDGIHFTGYGYNLISDHIRKVMAVKLAIFKTKKPHAAH